MDVTNSKSGQISKTLPGKDGRHGETPPPHKDVGSLLGDKPKHVSQASRLIQLTEDASLFHSPDGEAFATVRVDGHEETLPIGSSAFRAWLTNKYYKADQGAPSSQALAEARNLLAARAVCDGPATPVFVRVGQRNGAIYMDLGDREWRTVEISSVGYRILPKSPVKFRRVAGAAPLPYPVDGGNFEELRQFINVTADDLILIVAWIIGACWSSGPYPVLVFSGPQGSAKTTATRIVRQLLDPRSVAVRSMPKDVRDLMIAVKNNWCLALDNLSSIPIWLSDGLCRLSTGGGSGTRRLYSDDEEVLFDAQRPCILNGIEELATRSDLLERCLMVDLAPIEDSQRRTEDELWAAFEQAKPRLFGCLLRALSTALANLPVNMPRRPRMADFAERVIAAEPACGWPESAFMAEYEQNRTDAKMLAMEASPVVAPLVKFMSKNDYWKGTATELLPIVTECADDTTRKGKSWPKSAKALGGILHRLALDFPAVGLRVDFDRARTPNRNRIIEIHRADFDAKRQGSIAPGETTNRAFDAGNVDDVDVVDDWDDVVPERCSDVPDDWDDVVSER